MKTNYSIMGSKEVKLFLKKIEAQFGAVPKLLKTLAFVQGKEKIYALTKEADKIDLSRVRINNLGLYIAEVKNDQLRLSIEGAQIIGPEAKKNVHELSKEELKEWFKGNDIDVKGEYEGFVILKHGNDYIGSGKHKEGMILNFVPKARRLLEMH